MKEYKKMIIAIMLGVFLGGGALLLAYNFVSMIYADHNQIKANTSDISGIVDFINKGIKAQQEASKPVK